MAARKRYRICSCGEKIDIHKRKALAVHRERCHRIPLKQYDYPPKVWIGNRLVGLI